MKNPEALKAVQKAITCLWICFVISMLSSSMVFFISEPKSLESRLSPSGISFETYKLCMVAIDIVMGLIMYFVIKNLKNGRNWARIICLIYSLPLILINVVYISKYIFGPLHDIIDSIINALRVWYASYALYLIFNYPGKFLFEKNSNSIENKTAT